MQKKIIALAVAGLASSAAFAQTNVTIYGIADAYVGQVSTSAGHARVVNSGGLSGSRLGFRGTEDLGNGLKALFTLEYGLAIDSNTGVGTGATTTARQQFVGLTGGFGTAVAGRLQTPGYNASVKFDPLAASAFSGLLNLTNANSTTTINAASRVNNAVAYVTPTFSGFSAIAAYAAGEQVVGDNSAGRVRKAQGINALGLNYDNGPLAVGYVWHKASHFGGTVGGNDNANGGDSEAANITEHFLGASYDFKVVKLFASYQQAAVNSQLTVSGDTEKDKIYQIGAAIPVGGKGSVRVGVTRLDNGNKTGAADNSDDGTQYSLAYLHSLSPRTTAYVGYSRLTNQANGRLSYLGLTPDQPGSHVTGVAAGVNHAF